MTEPLGLLSSAVQKRKCYPLVLVKQRINGQWGYVNSSLEGLHLGENGSSLVTVLRVSCCISCRTEMVEGPLYLLYQL